MNRSLSRRQLTCLQQIQFLPATWSVACLCRALVHRALDLRALLHFIQAVACLIFHTSSCPAYLLALHHLRQLCQQVSSLCMPGCMLVRKPTCSGSRDFTPAVAMPHLLSVRHRNLCVHRCANLHSRQHRGCNSLSFRRHHSLRRCSILRLLRLTCRHTFLPRRRLVNRVKDRLTERPPSRCRTSEHMVIQLPLRNSLNLGRRSHLRTTALLTPRRRQVRFLIQQRQEQNPHGLEHLQSSLKQ